MTLLARVMFVVCFLTLVSYSRAVDPFTNLRLRPHLIAAQDDRSGAWRRRLLNSRRHWLPPAASPMPGDVMRVTPPGHLLLELGPGLHAASGGSPGLQ